MNYAECKATVNTPGKFEGAPVWAPFFWSQDGEDGQLDTPVGLVRRFNVTAEDRKMFPELKGRRVVRLMENEYGFVESAR